MQRSLTIVLIMLISHSAFAWGFWAHQRINRLAVFTLPVDMIDFFKANIEYVTEHAVDPDKRRYVLNGEAEKHFIDLDHYCTLPCDSFPKRWLDAIDTYSEDTLRAYGIVPWAIEQYSYRLTKAFQEKDANKILKYASDLGHYIGDSHVPLHTTVNYNGQLTDQKGIHGFWESRLPELFHEDYDFFVGKSVYIQDINTFVWKEIRHAHSLMTTVLREEKKLDASFPPDQKYSYETRGQTTVRTYSREYSLAYHLILDGMVEAQMRRSIKHVGDLWLTAWVNAGQPSLQDLHMYKDTIPTNYKVENKKRLLSREHAATGLEIFSATKEVVPVEIGE